MEEHISDIKFYTTKIALSRLKQEGSVKMRFVQAKIIKLTSTYHDSINNESIEIVCKWDKTCDESLSYNIPIYGIDYLE